MSHVYYAGAAINMGNLPWTWWCDIPDEWQYEVYRLDRRNRLIRDKRSKKIYVVRRTGNKGFVKQGWDLIHGWMVNVEFPVERQSLTHMLASLDDRWSWGPNREAALEEQNRRMFRVEEAMEEEADARIDAAVDGEMMPDMRDSLVQRVQGSKGLTGERKWEPKEAVA